VGGRGRDGDYARFAEASLGLADAAARLPRRARFGVEMTVLRVCESEQVARSALLDRSARRLELAASGVDSARTMLADAALDARRRRSLRLVV